MHKRWMAVGVRGDGRWEMGDERWVMGKEGQRKLDHSRWCIEDEACCSSLQPTATATRQEYLMLESVWRFRIYEEGGSFSSMVTCIVSKADMEEGAMGTHFPVREWRELRELRIFKSCQCQWLSTERDARDAKKGQ